MQGPSRKMECGMFKEGEEELVAGMYNCSALITLAHSTCIRMCKGLCSVEHTGKHFDGDNQSMRLACKMVPVNQ